VTGTAKNVRAENFLARHSFWLGLAAVAAAFITGAVLTWRKWPDLFGDFGMQLYIPWRLADGAVLYRDLFYMAGGPLSQYWHAALFKIFGASFLTLIISNLAIAAALLLVIYRCFERAADTLTATLVALAVVVGFVFAQYTGIGNCNYLAPYSHEMVHGLALSVLALALMAGWLADKNFRALLGAGFCAGLAALAKPDIFLALLLTLAAAFGLSCLKTGARKIPFKAAALFILAALVPLAGCFLFFLRLAGWRESLRLEFFCWRPIFTAGVVDSPYYQWSLGLDAPFDHTRQTALYFLVCGSIVFFYAAVFKRTKNLAAPGRWIANGAALIPVLLAAIKFNWPDVGAVLPLLGLVAVAILWRQFRRRPAGQNNLFPLLWGVFGILLLAKQGVFPRIWHTGFVLAMPAFVSAVYLMLRLLPDFLEERFQVPHRPLRAGAMAVLLIALAGLAHTSAQFYSPKKLPAGHGADLIMASGPEGNAVEARNLNLALDWIGKNTPPHATLATLPEGVMLNYLSRRVNPTPCFDWNPTVLAVFGEKRMTAMFEQNAPDYIAVAEWQTYEFGTGYFGSQPGYGAELMGWIQKNYRPVALFGSEPLRNGLFGVKILKHKTEIPATNEIEIRPAIP
jgi:hypothetical protein